ncbi:MAG: bifunctional diguanylate cyclase/phosphohydrolase, partial [Desulfocucumaceae bacterium]
ERKKAEERLKYLSLHDSLTGVYNRAYFEQEMKRLQEGRFDCSGIILCDLDGLKFVNDTLGHDTGDILLINTAHIIKEAFRGSDMVARIGGDEYAVLLPDTDKVTIEGACHRIKKAIVRYNKAHPELPLSLSVGYAIGSKGNKSMAELFKEADNNMYREKLLRNQSNRSSIVQTLIKAMEARDFITEGHADRLQSVVARMGKALGLSDRKINDLRLLAQFHDIGKVGIPDRILFKEGPLNEEETKEMLRHSEIGHRIAQSSPDLSPVADWILKHHEWWNGKGYPLGLKGEAIPLECRILSIADAYDAMTNDRPYRKALSHESAVSELKRCSGKQFDSELVSIFMLTLEIESLKQQDK